MLDALKKVAAVSIEVVEKLMYFDAAPPVAKTSET